MSKEYYTEELVGIAPDKEVTPKGKYIWDVYVNRPNKDDLVIGDFYSQEEAILYMLKTFPTECNSKNPPYCLQRTIKQNPFKKIINDEIRYIKNVIKRLLELICLK